jgi:hypothetical protein
VWIEDNSFVTNVYQKPTNIGKVLNKVSECPQCYETSTVCALRQRAFKTCTYESDLKTELRTCKHILVNNWFLNRTADTEMSNYQFRNYLISNAAISDGNITAILPKADEQGYKVDERVLLSIIHNNIKSTADDGKIKLLIC